MVNVVLPCQYRVGFASVIRRYSVGGIVGAFSVPKRVNLANVSVLLMLFSVGLNSPAHSFEEVDLAPSDSCEQIYSLHDSLCEVTHFFRCEQNEHSDKSYFVARVYADGNISFESAFGDNNFTFKENWYDGEFRSHLSATESFFTEIIGSDEAPTTVVMKQKVLSTSNHPIGLSASGERTTKKILRSSESTEFFGKEAFGYEYSDSIQLKVEDEFPPFKSQNEGAGIFIPSINLYFWTKMATKHFDGENVAVSRQFTAFLSSDDPKFEDKTSQYSSKCSAAG